MKSTQKSERITLGEVCLVDWGNTSITKSSYVDSGYPAYSAAGQDGFLEFYEHDGTAVIVSAIGARCGKCFFASGKWTAIKNTIVIKAKEPKAADERFLFYQLNDEGIWPRSGSGQPFIGIGKAKQIPIILPPLEEQRAIAHALRAVEYARKVRHRELILERERKAALMQYLFTYGTRGEQRKQTKIGEMPENWEIRQLGEIAQIAYGLTVNGARRQSSNVAPYLTVANVTRGALRLDVVKEIGILKGDVENYRLTKGDVLFVEGNGNPKLLGSAATWNDELSLVLHQNHLIRARPNQDIVLPEWVMNYVNTDNGRTQLFGRAKTSSGLHSINSRVIGSLQIPIPSLAEQDTISNILQACNAKLDSLAKEEAFLDELFKAILEELMTGRLSAVPLIEAEAAA